MIIVVETTASAVVVFGYGVAFVVVVSVAATAEATKTRHTKLVHPLPTTVRNSIHLFIETVRTLSRRLT